VKKRYHATVLAVPARETETRQAAPREGDLARMFLSAVSIGLGGGILVGWTRAGFDRWRGGMAAAALFVLMVLLWNVAWLRTAQTQEIQREYPPRPAPAPELAGLGPWRPGPPDGRKFARDALVQLNGEWSDLGGGTWRAMRRMGWTQERWTATRDWLIGNGFLRWRNERIPQLGTTWELARVKEWLKHGK